MKGVLNNVGKKTARLSKRYISSDRNRLGNLTPQLVEMFSKLINQLLIDYKNIQFHISSQNSSRLSGSPPESSEQSSLEFFENTMSRSEREIAVNCCFSDDTIDLAACGRGVSFGDDFSC